MSAKSDTVTCKTMIKYQFTGEELIEFGRAAANHQRARDEYEAQLTSIKSDYKGRIESAESERSINFRKLTDGYEMREVQAVVEFNLPKKGQKTLFLYDEDKEDHKGRLFVVASMTQADLQTVLSLEEPEKK